MKTIFTDDKRHKITYCMANQHQGTNMQFPQLSMQEQWYNPQKNLCVRMRKQYH